jgi:DNA-binding winged helix-turn-helix (wHTH) protein
MAHQTTTNPIIFAHDGPLSGSSWTLASQTIIGRDVNCDIQIVDRQVSRNHAMITYEGNGSVCITDLSSKNGVFVNGERISDSAELKDGDTIKIALVQELIFVSSDATIPLDITIQPQEEPSQQLFIDQNARRVWMGEEELLPPLSVQQYKLLTMLYNAENKVVSREVIISEVWGDDAAIGVTEQALDALVRRLRGRLDKKDPTHSYITTVRGVGFMFQNSVY